MEETHVAAQENTLYIDIPVTLTEVTNCVQRSIAIMMSEA
jgi:hypothetical protein